MIMVLKLAVVTTDKYLTETTHQIFSIPGKNKPFEKENKLVRTDMELPSPFVHEERYSAA